MKTKLIHEGAEKTFVVVFDTGDEVIGGLRRVAEENHLGASHFTAIGAFSEVTLGFFDLTKEGLQKDSDKRATGSRRPNGRRNPSLRMPVLKYTLMSW